MEQVVHHIEILITKDGHRFMKKFCSQYGFRLSAYRKTSYCQQWLVADQQIKFLITYATPTLKKECDNETNNNTKEEHCDLLMRTDPYVTWPTVCEHPDDKTESALFDSSCDRKTPSSVFNVCLAVNNIEQQVERLQNCGVTFVRPLETISDENGWVTLTTIRSCVGNVVHTLIERRNYRGRFLPGFISKSDCEIADEKEKSFLYTNFDHVTFAVYSGTSTSVIRWYERCFGMSRFNINRSEDKMEDYVINLPGTALRLSALEYWKCAETGVCSKNTDGSTNILFVIAESLPGSASNQVETFLKEHGGPGIQHVGLLTNTILNTIEWLKGQGVPFVEPPYTYYKEVEPLIEKFGNFVINLDKLKKLGILIDVENKENEEEKPRSLMQKFTKPLFEENTFFLEVIQREGALGFGSANIIALSKSLQVMLDEKSQQLQHINSYT